MCVLIFCNNIRPNYNEIKIYTDILEYNDISYSVVDSSIENHWEQLSQTKYFIFKWWQRVLPIAKPSG